MARVFYFGPAGTQLLGVFHPSTDRVQKSEGILLCYPGPQEYMRNHWAMRRLAGMLSQRGFPTLRFDYYGTGDSAGETNAGTPSRWQQDIVLAHEELVNLTQVRQVSIVGFRLGAALAAHAVNAGLKVKSLALWDPVVSGSTYLAELTKQEEWERAWSLSPGSRSAMHLLGYPFSEVERRETASIDLTQLSLSSIPRLGLFDDGTQTDADRLTVAWKAQGVNYAKSIVTEDVAQNRHGMTMANKMLAEITTWLDMGPV
jgi:uncharacterized protein